MIFLWPNWTQWSMFHRSQIKSYFPSKLNKVFWKWPYSFPYCGQLLFYSPGIDVIISIGLHLGVGGYHCWSLLALMWSSWTLRKASPSSWVCPIWVMALPPSYGPDWSQSLDRLYPFTRDFTHLGPFSLPITLLPTSFGFLKTELDLWVSINFPLTVTKLPLREKRKKHLFGSAFRGLGPTCLGLL